MKHKYETQVEFDGYIFDVLASVYYPNHMAEDDLPEVEINDVSYVDEVKGMIHDEEDFLNVIESDCFIRFAKEQIIGDFS